MSAFVDASVIVGIVAREEDAEHLAAKLNATDGPFYVSSIARYEATVSIARKKAAPSTRLSPELISEASQSVAAFLAEIGAVDVSLVGDIADRALAASGVYGKVVGHPARLNMGDCFAYACARSKNARLLFKGDDFSKTDISAA